MTETRVPAKYLLIASTFPPIVGGSSTVYENLLRAAGGELALLTGRRDYRSGELLPPSARPVGADDRDVARIDLVRPLMAEVDGKRRPIPRRLAGDARLVLGLLLYLGRRLRRDRIRAVIVGELIYGGWIGLVARYFFRRPSVIYVHGEELAPRRDSFSERMKGFYLRRASGVVAVSSYTRDRLVEMYAVPPSRVARIANGVDTSRFHPRQPRAELRARYDLEDKKVLLTVGRLVPRKGIDSVLKALPAVLADEPQAHYLIVGDGPLSNELEALAVALGIRNRVTFCGQVEDDDLVDHYALGDVFVMPNRQMPDGNTEGFGLVFLEANACGLPVIAGRAGGTGDAVSDGENGLLVDGNDVAAVTAAILRLLGDEALAEGLGRTGLARARAADWRHRWRELSAFLARIAGDDDARS